MMIMGQVTAVTAVGQLAETYVLIVLVDPAAAEDLVEDTVEVAAVVKVLEEVATAVPRTSSARMSIPVVDP